MSSTKLVKLLHLVWLIYLNCMMMHGLANVKFMLNNLQLPFLSADSLIVCVCVYRHTQTLSQHEEGLKKTMEISGPQTIWCQF